MQLLLIIIACCAALILVSRVADFLLGRRGNKWLYDHLIYAPWYSLEKADLLNTLRSAARLFERTTKAMFGEKLFSFRAYVASLCIGGLVAFFLMVFVVAHDTVEV